MPFVAGLRIGAEAITDEPNRSKASVPVSVVLGEGGVDIVVVVARTGGRSAFGLLSGIQGAHWPS